MIILHGKYGNAFVYTDLVDNASQGQIVALLNQPFAEGANIRLMPDVHAGAGCTIGTTMQIHDKVCPNLVGVDIGCGMLVTKIKDKNIEFSKLDSVIREFVPSGFKKHTNCDYDDEIENLINDLRAKCVDMKDAQESYGSLGGGNHFIEVNKDDDGAYYLVIHSGSRHPGLTIANYYQKQAIDQLKGIDIPTLERKKKELVEKLKAEHRENEIDKELHELKKGNPTNIPPNLAYLTGQLFEDYIHDMKLMQLYATKNRHKMKSIIMKKMGFSQEFEFETIHNYIDIEKMILRKGAVSAQEGERLIIPMNMRDGSLICIGKGNPEWNYSAPHGAGRLMSRSEAKSTLTLTEFKKQMEGIFSTSVTRATIDESPMAYKPMETIVENIGPTCNIEKIIKPVYNFKASETVDSKIRKKNKSN